MYYSMKLDILLMVLLLAGYSAWAQEASGLTILNTRVTPDIVSPGDSVLISCSVSHPLGRAGIIRVAASIFYGNRVTTLPRLYDNATHGDKISGDGIYSINVSAPVNSGQPKIIFYAVAKGRNEIESKPVFFYSRVNLTNFYYSVFIHRCDV